MPRKKSQKKLFDILTLIFLDMTKNKKSKFNKQDQIKPKSHCIAKERINKIPPHSHCGLSLERVMSAFCSVTCGQTIYLLCQKGHTVPVPPLPLAVSPPHPMLSSPLHGPIHKLQKHRWVDLSGILICCAEVFCSVFDTDVIRCELIEGQRKKTHVSMILMPFKRTFS